MLVCWIPKEGSEVQVRVRLIDIVDILSCVTLHFFNFGFFFKLSTPSLPTSANSLFDLVFRTVDNAGAGWNLSGLRVSLSLAWLLSVQVSIWGYRSCYILLFWRTKRAARPLLGYLDDLASF